MTERMTVPDLAALDLLAARIAATLRPGRAVMLRGPLGAGKTALARAILRALTGDAALEVPSPSYTLLQTYETPRGPLHHLDLWRLGDWRAVSELGFADACEDMLLVEWPDRLGPLTPADAVWVDIAVAADEVCRVITVRDGLAPEPRA